MSPFLQRRRRLLTTTSLDSWQFVAGLQERLGDKVTVPELDAIMEDLDGDGSGQVDSGEFKAWWETRM